MKDLKKNYYLKKSIELAEEAKKTITLETSIIYDFPNDNELGKQIRKMITEKVDEANKYIKNIENLILERS
jgi:hypothetical protein